MKNKFKKALMRDFGKAARKYDEYAILQRNVADKLFALSKQFFSAENSVIDIGCGTGYFHELCRKNAFYFPITQIDISPEMCEIAASYASSGKYGETTTIQADMDNIPLPENSIKNAFSSLTIQWSQDLENTLKEAHRILDKGGDFFASTLQNGTLHELENSFSKLDRLTHINKFLSKNDIQNTFINCGFKNIKIIEDDIITYHDNLLSLLKQIKGIGANHKSSDKKFLGKDYFVKLEKIYQDSFANNGKLPSTWKVVYITCQK